MKTTFILILIPLLAACVPPAANTVRPSDAELFLWHQQQAHQWFQQHENARFRRYQDNMPATRCMLYGEC